MSWEPKEGKIYEYVFDKGLGRRVTTYQVFKKDQIIEDVMFEGVRNLPISMIDYEMAQDIPDDVSYRHLLISNDEIPDHVKENPKRYKLLIIENPEAE